MVFSLNASKRKRKTTALGICALAMASGLASARPGAVRADLNSDGRIDRTDVVMLLQAMIASISATTPAAYQAQVAAGDVNGDRRLTITDMQTMLNAMGSGASTVNVGAELQSLGVGANFLQQMINPPAPPTGGSATPPANQPPANAPPAPPPPGGAPPLPGPNATPVNDPNATQGMNLDFVNYFTRQWAFVDIMRVARPWATNDANAPGTDTRQSAAFQWDENGYPMKAPVTAPGRPQPQVLVTQMYRDTDGHYPAGNYVCLYNGSGEIQFSGDATVVSQGPGRMVVRVEPTRVGIFMRIMRSDEGNRLRNIRLIMPGFEQTYATQPFHPIFLQRLAGFKTLRFLNWMQVNNSAQKEWADRPTVTDYTQGSDKGVALELQIDLCNKLGVNPWFTIPHQASDAYIHEFAALVKNRLRPELEVYVEYSNEVWNAVFQQSQWCSNQGRQQHLASDALGALTAYYAKRSGETFEQFEDVFGGTGRLVRVIASQHAQPALSQRIVDSFVSRFGENKFDALAVAPYFGARLCRAENVAMLSAMTPEQLITRLGPELDTCISLMGQQATVARNAEVRLVSYEAGQHLSGLENNEVITTLFNNTNRNPGMQALLDRHLREWRRAGGREYLALSLVTAYNKWGSWGYLEYQDQPVSQAPKFRSLTQSALAPPH